MSTKTKGDILAERIESIKSDFDGLQGLSEILGEALADYYRPWTLVRSVNGFTLGEGQEWHRNDWTEDMLPDGWRPHILGERNEGDDYYFDDGRWHSMQQTLAKTTSYDLHIRTRRPLPPVIDPYAELKAALKAGKTIQMRGPEPDADDWTDMPNPEFMARVERYRIKPAPKLVPLGPEDVPPGSVIRKIKNPSSLWTIVAAVSVDGIKTDRESFGDWLKLQSDYEISRDNGKTWKPCSKEAK